MYRKRKIRAPSADMAGSAWYPLPDESSGRRMNKTTLNKPQCNRIISISQTEQGISEAAKQTSHAE